MIKFRNKYIYDAIIDFFRCCHTTDTGNVFYKDHDAKHFAKSVVKAKNQKRQFVRHGLIPNAFITYLLAKEPLLNEINFPKNKLTIEEFTNLLECSYEPLVKRRYPMLKFSFGSSEFLWDKD